MRYILKLANDENTNAATKKKVREADALKADTQKEMEQIEVTAKMHVNLAWQ